MGNSCHLMHCNINVAYNQLFSLCFPHEGAPRRRTSGDLRDDFARLKSENEFVQRKIREGRPEMQPPEQANQWLQQVQALEGKIQTLLTKVVENQEMRPPAPEQVIHKSQCFCVYWRQRRCVKKYFLWMKVHAMDKKVLDLLAQAPKDGHIVERPRIAPAQRVPTEPTIGTNTTFNEVWSHVVNEQDDLVRLVGLYGMGGVGKTTILKEVNEKLCDARQKFDLQLWVVATKSPSLANIQNYIGEKIGFHSEAWKEKSEDGKAMDILSVLYDKKYILLLDDIWERFDLAKIGIPLPNMINKSMVIFTTRSKQVCGQMKAREIPVQCLNDEDAWNLFKENVGEKTLNAHHDVPRLAKDVMKECSGLPLALIVIGRSMTMKTTTHDWEHAIQVLKRYAAELSDIKVEVLTPLKYSYDNLSSDAIRYCFLYCSLYPEDKDIPRHDLVDKWICEGFLGESGDLLEDRNQGYSHITSLVNASLLQECSPGRVKMHDVIRDMALWISDDLGYYVKAGANVTRIPHDVDWERVQKISFMDSPIKELKGPAETSNNLKTILLTHCELWHINNEFLRFAPTLSVLDLSFNFNLSSLPEELFKLHTLQYLNLENIFISELPEAMKNLVNLKYLNVFNTEVLTIPEGVLSSMKKLSMLRCGSRRRSCNNFLGESLVKEFDDLQYLQLVHIPANSEHEISNMISSVNLLTCIRHLTMTSFDDSTTLNIRFLKDMTHLHSLSMENLEGVKEIVAGEERGIEETSTINSQNGFNALCSLSLLNCGQLKNLSWVLLFPNVESIEVECCWNLQTLVSEQSEYTLDNGAQEPFVRLCNLRLAWLPQLTSIYYTSLSFPCLENLSVGGDCNNLRKLPFDSSSCKYQGRGVTIRGANSWWNELQWEDNEAARATLSSRFQKYNVPADYLGR